MLFSILPYSEGMTSSDIINKFKGRLPELINEFTIIKDINLNSNPQIKNLNDEFVIKQNQNITFISKNSYRQLINDYNTSVNTPLINDVQDSDVVKVYYDKKLLLLLAPNNAVSNLQILNEIIDTNEFYKLYIGFSSKENNEKIWALRSYDASTFFSESQNIILSASSVVNLFSEQYIREKFVNSLDRKELLKDEANYLLMIIKVLRLKMKKLRLIV